MFVDTNANYEFQTEERYNSQPLSASFSCASSIDEYILTPASTPQRQQSMGQCIKTENLSVSFSRPSRTPDSFVVPNDFCSVPAMSQEGVDGFQGSFLSHDQSFDGLDLSAFNNNFTHFVTQENQPFIGHDGLPNCASALDFSSSSSMDTSVSESFIVPSRTQTQNAFMDMESPPRSNSMHFVVQYDSPASDFSSCITAPTQSPVRDAGSYDVFNSTASSPCTPTRPTGFRNQRFATLPSSTALHRIQEQSPVKGDYALRDYQQHMQRSMRKSFKRPSAYEPVISFCEASKKPCPWHGCERKFKRSEHLKRHFDTHTKKLEDGVLCAFCPKQKWFTRPDNYKAHLKLHLKVHGGSKRTPYHPDAAAAFYALKSKPRTKRERGEVMER